MTARPAVAIVILGAAVWPGGHPSPTLARRTAEGARQWHAGAGRVVLPCGGTGRHPPAEAEVMRALLLAAGVPDAAIHPETASASTAQNLRNARAILRDLGIDRVCLVSDRWHLPRARLIARRLGLGVAASAAPPVLGGGARPLTQLRGALREIPAYLVALLTGAGQR